MQPDCIAQSSKLSVCGCGVFVRAGGGAGLRAPEHPLCPPPSSGSGDASTGDCSHFRERGGSGPGGSGGGRAHRGGLAAPQPLGATGGRAGARRTGARRPRRLGEGCARVPWFCPELFGVTCRLQLLSWVPAGLGGGGGVGVGGRLGTGGTRQTLETEELVLGGEGHLLSPVGTDPGSATHLAPPASPPPPEPLPPRRVPSERAAGGTGRDASRP